MSTDFFLLFSLYHCDSSAQLQLALLLKYFKVLTSDTVTHSPAGGSTQTPPPTPSHPEGFHSLSSPSARPLKVALVVGDGELAVGDGVHRFALLHPALGSGLRLRLVLGEGQVGGDAVPHTVAQHVVAAAVRVEQLSAVERRDGQIRYEGEPKEAAVKDLNNLQQ